MPKGIYDRAKSKTRSPQSEKAKIKIGIANKGKKRTPEQIQRIKDSLPKNRKLSKKHRIKITESLKGKQSRNWKGGSQISNGYRLIYKPDHPYCNGRGYILEHRLIAEKYLKRYLLSTEIVHHVNENTLDNRVENLIVFTGIGYHIAFHKFQKCLKNGISLYLGPPLVFCVKNMP